MTQRRASSARSASTSSSSPRAQTTHTASTRTASSPSPPPLSYPAIPIPSHPPVSKTLKQKAQPWHLPRPAATITALDHLVLTVKSIPATRAWYVQNLGMRAESFVSADSPDVTRHSLIFGRQKINVHESGNEFEPKAQSVMPGSADLCFLTDDGVDEVWKRFVEGGGVAMVDVGTADGTVFRTGARGKLLSVNCRDPDGNLIE